MTVGPETEMDEIEHGRHTSDLLKQSPITSSGGNEIVFIDRHRMHCSGRSGI
jgi:hypothetical protein